MNETKERFISDLRDMLYNSHIPDINIVIDLVSIALKDFDISYKETSLVLYDDSDKQIFHKFFVAKAVEELSPNSLKYYNIVISKFLVKIGKHIKEVSTDDVRVYLAYKKLEKVSDNTLNNIRRVLSSFFSWCVEEDYVSRNPMLRIKGVRQVKKIRKSLTEDEMEMLRAGTRTKRDRAIIEFLFSTGCRVSEMINVNRVDLDLVNGQVDVLGKGRKYRTVYLSSRCKIAIQEYLSTRSDNLDALFISTWEGMKGGLNGSPARISKSAVEIMLRNLGNRIGISNVHPHKFRRTAATTALRRGMPIEQVQRMLGHESIQTTTIYAQSTNDEVKLNHEKFIV